jgi:serine/threonine-protein kinase
VINMTQPLSRIGRYTIEREIGRGGFAVVYKAHDEVLGQTVALKLLRTELLDNKALVERFIREAQLLLNLKHPNIVPLYNIDRADTGAYYLVMEYAAGGTLKAYIAERKAAGALPTPAQTAHVISQVADALDAAHARGLLHRDVKASNVLLQSLGEPSRPGGAPRIKHVYLADFGLAKVARRTDNSVDFTMTERDGFGNTAGTLGYIAPEMLDFSSTAAIDAKADQYSLAVVAFEMLTGRLPFEATPDQSPFVIVDPIVRRPAPTVREINPGLPAEIGAAITRALAKDPGARFGSCGEFAKALQGEVEAASARVLTGAKAAIDHALGNNLIATAQMALSNALALDPEVAGLAELQSRIDGQRSAWDRFKAADSALSDSIALMRELNALYPSFRSTSNSTGPVQLAGAPQVVVGGDVSARSSPDTGIADTVATSTVYSVGGADASETDHSASEGSSIARADGVATEVASGGNGPSLWRVVLAVAVGFFVFVAIGSSGGSPILGAVFLVLATVLSYLMFSAFSTGG